MMRPIPANKNRPTLFINPNTVAYIFSLIIDSATVHNAESPHARALQYEATVLKVLKSMPADDFRSELRSALISYYDGILKIPVACGRPEAQVFKRSFNARRSVDPPACAAAAAAAPPPDDPAPRPDAPAPPPAGQTPATPAQTAPKPAAPRSAAPLPAANTGAVPQATPAPTPAGWTGQAAAALDRTAYGANRAELLKAADAALGGMLGRR